MPQEESVKPLPIKGKKRSLAKDGPNRLTQKILRIALEEFSGETLSGAKSYETNRFSALFGANLFTPDGWKASATIMEIPNDQP